MPEIDLTKPAHVKIVLLTSTRGESYDSLYGMGNDGRMYWWSYGELCWKLCTK